MGQPDEFNSALQRYQPYLSTEQFASLMRESQRIAPSAVRLNLLLAQTSSDQRLNYLSQKYGWSTKTLPFSEDSRQILDAQTSPSQTREFLLGQYYLQDAASLLPVSLFSPSKNRLLKLDMAASPGGKTTQMVDQSLDRDFVIANDSAASRLPALRTVLQSWGAANYAITNFPGERWGDWYPQTFDQILLDAPCSMESLRASSSHPHRPISTDERARLAGRQEALLVSAAKALKIGGELVYSTCTLAPEENEAVVSSLLEAYPGAFHIDPAPARRYQAHGLVEFEGQNFNPDLAHALRIWPFHFQTNGFFAVKLIKDQEISSDRSNPPERDFTATGLSVLSPQLEHELTAFIAETYGFDFAGHLEELGLCLMRRENTIHLLPVGYLSSFASLPYNAIGLTVGRYIRDKFEANVGFILRFGAEFSRNIWTIPEDLLDRWMKGYDIRGVEPAGFELGTAIAVRDSEGNNLGAAKYSSRRLRNLLPNRHISQ